MQLEIGKLCNPQIYPKKLQNTNDKTWIRNNNFIPQSNQILKYNQKKIQTTIRILESNAKSLSVSHLSPLGSQTSFSTLSQTRIENVVDWEAISKKYRALFGLEGDDSSSLKEGSSEEGDNKSKIIDTGAAV